jgi:hypothetical protein
LLPHEAIVSRWKAVFLLRRYNRREKSIIIVSSTKQERNKKMEKITYDQKLTLDNKGHSRADLT